MTASPDPDRWQCPLARLRRLCRESRPPEPAAAQWAGVLAGIHAGLNRSAGAPAGAPHLRSRHAMLAAVAAGVALLVGGPLWQRPVDSPGGAAAAEAVGFPLLSPTDVDVLSLRPADAGGLLVGRAPVDDDFQLVANGDVALISVQPGPGGTRLELVEPDDPTAVPMLVSSAPALTEFGGIRDDARLVLDGVVLLSL